ncbi:hypothetical protein J6Z19_03770 [bacterium]|nr:hypothetical protein [bacterium]
MRKYFVLFLFLPFVFFSGCENSINSRKTDTSVTEDDSRTNDQDTSADDADAPETVDDDADAPEVTDENEISDTGEVDADVLENSDDADNSDDEPVVCETDPLFCFGQYYVNVINVASGDDGSPRQFRIYEPIGAEGKIPVVHFLHGFMYKISYYDDFLMRLASHGFIVVSSQSEHKMVNGDTTIKEAEKVITFINWLKQNIQSKVSVTADVEHFGVSGHSRGGKVMNRVLNTDPSIATSFFGVDPVDSAPPLDGFIGDDDPQSLNVPVRFTGESMFLGTEKGPKNKLNGNTGACAPKNDNSVNFYAAYPSPSHHIIAAGVGHADMVDPEDVKACNVYCSTCAGSGDKGMNLMFIAYTGGLMTAFFNSTLKGLTEYENILNDPSLYPFATTVVEHK